jgi:glycosyltransferase involved in cell wall biosynthesis
VAGTGSKQAAWQALSRALGLEARVTFLGRVADDDLPALYQRADVFVLPANTRAESFGTVLLEAMAAGLPCITTEIGSGTSYVVEHERTGLVVAPRQPAALARAINALAADPAWRARLGAAGRARVESTFTQARMVAAVEAVYTAVVDLKSA